MSDKWRFILDIEGTAAKTMTVPIAALSNRAAGKIPNGVAIYYFPKPCISFGYFQDIDTDIDVELAKKHNIEISRRIEGIGGGTIFLDPTGLIALGIIADSSVFSSMEDAFHKSGEALTEVYKVLGVEDAKYYPPDDVRAEGSGRKLGAVGVTEMFGIYAVVSTNMPGYISSEILPKIGRIPAEKFKDKKIKTFEEYQGGVEAEIGYQPNPYEFSGAVYKVFQEEFGVEFTPGTYSKEEVDMIESLTPRFQSEEHIYALSSKRRFSEAPSNYKMGLGRYKTGKLVESRVLVDPDGIIKDMFFCGDFYAKPVPVLREVEKSLVGLSIKDDDAMLEKIKVAYQDPNWGTSEIVAEDFLKALIAARESIYGK
ncbi:MAG: lipoate--protein ligase family protein [Candidatus Jordarchaeum sp.]|uniref:lipoate--protein ligase family protein n=1 Tax=Candidatus Jordarchaeum sp. TaxID=2823881 RepID=UPI00404AC5EC